jgi:hypothetical protein
MDMVGNELSMEMHRCKAVLTVPLRFSPVPPHLVLHLALLLKKQRRFTGEERRGTVKKKPEPTWTAWEWA